MILNDRYQLEQTLGTGGMALVYKAKDLMLERSVAVNVLREDLSTDMSFRERFRQEALTEGHIGGKILAQHFNCHTALKHQVFSFID